MQCSGGGQRAVDQLVDLHELFEEYLALVANGRERVLQVARDYPQCGHLGLA